MKKEKWKPEIPGGFFPLYHRILSSEIFNSLSVYSQIIYIRALDKANLASKYDGLFTLTPSDFKNSSLKVSTFRKHIKPLIIKGLIEIVKQGGMFKNANKYQLIPLRNLFTSNLYKHWGREI